MKHYAWQGINQHGQITQGNIKAKSKQLAMFELAKQHISLTQLHEQSALSTQYAFHMNWFILFSQYMHLLLSSGLSLIQTIHLYTKNLQDKALKQTLQTVINDMNQGTPLSQALKSNIAQLPASYLGLLQVGEQTGRIDLSFQQLTLHLSKQQKLRKNIQSALIYPVMTLSTAVILVILMLVFVIPQFETMYSSAQAELPLVTQYLINASEFLHIHFITLLNTIILLLGTQSLLCRYSITYRQWNDKQLFHLPFVKSIYQVSVLSQFSYQLSLSLQAGIPICNALTLSSQCINNIYFHQHITKLASKIEKGESLTKSIACNAIYSDTFEQFVHMGEQSGKLDEALSKAANIHEQELDNFATKLAQLIEPIIILFLGLVIGGILLAMYLPIFNLMTLY